MARERRETSAALRGRRRRARHLRALAGERCLHAGAEPPPGAERFVITMPPPNVTGALHIGHALFVTLEDLLVRYHRMRGDDTLWLPGVDHASIGAQFVLDKILAEEGETRDSLGRERYLERMWRFMDETRDVIGLQLRRLGRSPTGPASRFTMDDGARGPCAPPSSGCRTRAWSTAARRSSPGARAAARRSATSRGAARRDRHAMDDPLPPRTRRTARPTPTRGSASRPPAPRRCSATPPWRSTPTTSATATLVGREAILPFLGRRLPIVADPAVDREFGTGAVKITPAHDPNDYEIGKRHGPAGDQRARRGGAHQRAAAASSPGWTGSTPARRSSSGCATWATSRARAAPDWWSATASAAGRWSSRASRCSGSSASSRSPSGRSHPCAKDGHGSCPIAFREGLTRTGWRTSTTGRSAGSCGGAIASRPGSARTATSR